MNKIILTTIVGGVVGLLFGLLDLPIPAPPALSGVMGIVGIFGGYKVANYLIEHWDKIVELLPI
ncbi:MAG: XapX domain-containing protein [Halobacteriaceae archaeon]